MSSISRRRNGLMALSVIGAPVLGEVLAPQSQDRTLTSRYSPNSPLATNYRESGLVHRRILVIAGRSGEGPLTEPTAAARAWQREPLFMPLTVVARGEPKGVGGWYAFLHAETGRNGRPTLSSPRRTQFGRTNLGPTRGRRRLHRIRGCGHNGAPRRSASKSRERNKSTASCNSRYIGRATD